MQSELYTLQPCDCYHQYNHLADFIIFLCLYYILLCCQPLGDLEMEKPLHLEESLKQQQAVEERRRSREVILVKIITIIMMMMVILMINVT